MWELLREISNDHPDDGLRKATTVGAMVMDTRPRAKPGRHSRSSRRRVDEVNQDRNDSTAGSPAASRRARLHHRARRKRIPLCAVIGR